MKTKFLSLLLGTALVAVAAVPAHAQSGFALKGSLVFNNSNIEAENFDAAGFNLGAELVLPMGIGIGVSGYTAGGPDDFDFSEGSLNFLAEANYFLNLPLLPVTPYAGVHTGLGSYNFDEISEGPRPEVDFSDLGYQAGIRLELTELIGLDAQYRRVSGSVAGEQDAEFENDQFLIGVTLF